MKRHSERFPTIQGIVTDATTGIMRDYVKEAYRGCSAGISSVPVALEPPLQPSSLLDFAKNGRPRAKGLSSPLKNRVNWRWMKVWVEKRFESKAQKDFFGLCDSLSVLRGPVSFAVCGNKKSISLFVGTEKRNCSTVKNALLSLHPGHELEDLGTGFLSVNDYSFVDLREYYTPLPYWRRLTAGDRRFLPAILAGLNSVEEDGFGLFQLIAAPVSDNSGWRSNVLNLSRLEQESAPLHVLRDWQEAGVSRATAGIEKKVESHLFSVLIRTAVFSKKRLELSVLRSFGLAFGGFLWGGENLRVVTGRDYLNVLDESVFRDMIQESVTYRAGSLLSAEELSYFSPLFEKSDLLHYPVEHIVLSVPDTVNKPGLLIGYVRKAGRLLEYSLPEEKKPQGISVSGSTGSGKSNWQTFVIANELSDKRSLLDVQSPVKKSLVALDSSGDGYSLWLHKLGRGDHRFVRLFDPTIPGYVPKFDVVSFDPRYETLTGKAEYLTSALCRLFPGDELSSGIEQMFENGFYLLLADKEARLIDLPDILGDASGSEYSYETKFKRARALSQVVNPQVQKFWSHDYETIDRYKKKNVIRKVRKFLLNPRMQAIASSTENHFSIHEAIHEGLFYFVNNNCASLPPNTSAFLSTIKIGAVYEAMVWLTNLSPDERRFYPSLMLADEFFRFAPKHWDAFLVSARKFVLTLCISWHFKEQLSPATLAGVKNLGTTIALQQDAELARTFAYSTFNKKIEPEEIANLKPGSGFVISPDRIVRPFEWPEQISDGDPEVIRDIVDHNLREHYVRVSDESVIQESRSRIGDEI